MTTDALTLAPETPAHVPYTTGVAARACCICGLPLTDAASIEAGIGPICRKRANEVLARTFPCDWRAAFEGCTNARERGTLRGVPPCATNTLEAVLAAIMFAEDGPTRTDWRKVINQMSWLLSHNEISRSLREFLYSTAIALGYRATVALWRGEMVIGAATATLTGGHSITIQSPRPGEVVRAGMKGLGFRFNPGDKTWTVRPANAERLAEVEAFLRGSFLALRGLDEAVEEIRAALAAPPAPTPAQAPARPSVMVWRMGSIINIISPYNADFIAAIRRLPQRRWNAADRAWEVSVDEANEVRRLVKEHYGVEVLA